MCSAPRSTPGRCWKEGTSDVLGEQPAGVRGGSRGRRVEGAGRGRVAGEEEWRRPPGSHAFQVLGKWFITAVVETEGLTGDRVFPITFSALSDTHVWASTTLRSVFGLLLAARWPRFPRPEALHQAGLGSGCEPTPFRVLRPSVGVGRG